MNKIDPITHVLTLGTILLVAAFFAVLFAGMALFEKIDGDIDTCEFDPCEIDNTPYPLEDDELIFPKY